MDLPDTPPLRGRTEIRRHLEGVVERFAAQTRRASLAHHVATLRVWRTAPPDAARAESYFSVYTEIGLDHWGVYRDRLRCENGRWLLAERRVHVDGAVAGSRLVRP